MDDLVIGSGPAGVAAATALLARGRSVTMIDGGKRLEADRAAARDRLASAPPELWRDADRTDWQEAQSGAAAGQVRRYGSDFAMEPAGDTFVSGQDRFHLRASRAEGGLSNLWGSALLPYAAADMAGWPISAADLAPHIRAVADFMPVAGRSDDLEALFPSLPMAGRTPLAPSPQGARLLARFAAARSALAAIGITTGQARQAVAGGCRLCGQCLHGCPWQLIWKASHQIERLRTDARFTYRPGLIARHLSDDTDGVTVHLADGQSLRAARVFLGAGVLETARILMASDPGQRPMTLRDSAHGFLPTLHLWPSPRRPDRGPFHTLTQAFAELQDQSVSPHLVHAQLYSWNNHFERELVQSYARRLPGSAPFWRALARRLIAAQIFLHSDHSAKVRLSLATDGRLIAAVEPNPGTAATFDKAARSLARGLRKAGLAPLTFARRLNPPGSSFHVGASLPMAKAPLSGQSDLAGRPHGLSRIHVIDATVLPAIPATTITLPVMANAHRIAATVA